MLIAQSQHRRRACAPQITQCQAGCAVDSGHALALRSGKPALRTGSAMAAYAAGSDRDRGGREMQCIRVAGRDRDGAGERYRGFATAPGQSCSERGRSAPIWEHQSRHILPSPETYAGDRLPAAAASKHQVKDRAYLAAAQCASSYSTSIKKVSLGRASSAPTMKRHLANL